MPLTPGGRLGPYEILAPLGAGGMGEVYRALDTRLKREAALKCLPDRLAANSIALERFRREAQLLAGMSHPHIAAVYGLEIGSDGGAVLAMEMVGGETLADRLQRGPLPPEEAAAIALQIAQALEYAHERGIIHRDLKPANTKVTADDQVKVLDFGLAKALTPELSAAELADSPTLTTPATLAGSILGTAAYMAPEQARGKAVDRRADIWAFGAVLYEMLTGQRAFHGDNATDVIAAVVRAEPDWSALPPATPAYLRDLVERCLRKDARRRLQSIGDARITLEEKPSPPAAAAAAQRPAALAQRAWYGWAAPGFAGVVLAALAAYWLMPRPAKPVAMRFQAVTALAGVQRDPALSPDGRSVAFASNQDGNYNLYVGLIDGGNLLEITRGSDAKGHPAWTPDGASLAYQQLNPSGLWDIWEVSALGGTPHLLLRNAEDPAWSPDGKQLAYTQASTGTLWLSTPGQPPQELGRGIKGQQPRFSPDGKQLAFDVNKVGGPYGSLEVADLADASVRALTPTAGPEVLSPAWSSDGQSIYFASSRGGTVNIWKLPAAGGTPVQITAGQGDDAGLSVMGNRLVFATFRTNTRLAQLDLTAMAGPHAIHVLSTDPVRNQNAPAYSPDGKRLAFFCWLKGVELEQIWTSNADGSHAAPLVAGPLSNIFPEWSADGQSVLFTQWNTATGATDLAAVPADGGEPKIMWHSHQGAKPWLSDVSSRGVVAYPGPHGISTYDPSTGATRRVLPLPRQTSWVRWSPQGTAIAYDMPPRFDGDPEAGVWIDDLHQPPQQVFRGWVCYLARAPGGKLAILAGSSDLQGSLWTADWNGQHLKRLPQNMPLLYDYFFDAWNVISLSPNGRDLAFLYDDALQANLGMIEFGK